MSFFVIIKCTYIKILIFYLMLDANINYKTRNSKQNHL